MAAGPTVKQILQTYPGKIRLVIKNYPYKYRDFSKIAAEASLAARDQGKYWEMHDILLTRSPKLDRASLIAYADELGLDVKKFTESIDSGRHTKDIDGDMQACRVNGPLQHADLSISTAGRLSVSVLSITSKRSSTRN